jgi:hypothetical protein
MSSKKKKSSKKAPKSPKSPKKDQDAGEAVDPNAPAAEPVPKPITNEEILRKRLDEVSLRTHQYAHEIEKLKAAAKNRAEETQAMETYLSSEMKRRNVVNVRLLRFYTETSNKADMDIKGLQEQFESKLRRAEAVFLQKEAQLLAKNKQLVTEIEDLELYRKMREDLQTELNNTKHIIAQNELCHKQQLDVLERKFLDAKETLQREAAEMIQHSRKKYKDEVGKELDEESKMVRKENRKMRRDLSQCESVSNSLMRENEVLQKEVTKLQVRAPACRVSPEFVRGSHLCPEFVRTLWFLCWSQMELSLQHQNEREHDLRSEGQLKKIAALTERTNALERSLSKCIREYELEKEASLQQTTRQAQELSVGLESLVSVAKSKERQLKKLRFHAKQLLSERTEVHQFLLDEMDVVKSEIERTRKSEVQAALVKQNAELRALTLAAPPGPLRGAKASRTARSRPMFGPTALATGWPGPALLTPLTPSMLLHSATNGGGGGGGGGGAGSEADELPAQAQAQARPLDQVLASMGLGAVAEQLASTQSAAGVVAHSRPRSSASAASASRAAAGQVDGSAALKFLQSEGVQAEVGEGDLADVHPLSPRIRTPGSRPRTGVAVGAAGSVLTAAATAAASAGRGVAREGASARSRGSREGAMENAPVGPVETLEEDELRQDTPSEQMEEEEAEAEGVGTSFDGGQADTPGGGPGGGGVVDVTDLSLPDRYALLKMLLGKIKRGAADTIPMMPVHSFDLQFEPSVAPSRGSGATSRGSSAPQGQRGLPVHRARPRGLLWDLSASSSQVSTPRSAASPSRTAASKPAARKATATLPKLHELSELYRGAKQAQAAGSKDKAVLPTARSGWAGRTGKHELSSLGDEYDLNIM